MLLLAEEVGELAKAIRKNATDIKNSLIMIQLKVKLQMYFMS